MMLVGRVFARKTLSYEKIEEVCGILITEVDREGFEAEWTYLDRELKKEIIQDQLRGLRTALKEAREILP